LIDACISALHMHGPSRTTVEKVVALADMSPGIVRFYFDSKDAMLVASLAYLAAEFEERVMTPVSRLIDTPVKALEQLVELYLDPEIASPRKVSVWYSFWGEASSRQEYLEICGKKDDAFASLVRELVERMIAQTGQTHLDADGVALGLMGVLEVLWQGFAFTEEAKIDRAGARRRSFAFLRSVFPGQFRMSGDVGGPGVASRAGRRLDAAASDIDVGSADGEAALPAWAYSDNELLVLERDHLFRPSWQFVGHEADIPKKGDYLTADLAGERVLVVRVRERDIHAFRNSCRRRPHALVSGARGHLPSSKISCDIHGLVYELDGSFRSGDTPGDLASLELALPGRFILVRPPGLAPLAAPVWEPLPDLSSDGLADISVSADWKLIVEQWLDAPARPQGTRRTFLPPNQLLEISDGGALLLQVIPQSPGRCVIRRLDYSIAGKGRKSRRSTQAVAWLQQDIEVAESTQAGLAAGIDEADGAGPVSTELVEFRRSIRMLLALARSG
jgi:TetR/AcrR family transcriptional regulator, transcriptional repressor of bet genes